MLCNLKGLPDFQTKNLNFGKFWRALHRKMLVYFMAIWSISRLSGIPYGILEYFMVIWYIFPRFGTLYQGKSGNPAPLMLPQTKLHPHTHPSP
jgi:hypothetical protein